MAQVPVAEGVMLCECVVVAEGTRNLTIVNSFSERIVDNIPSEPISFVLVAMLTDGTDEVEIETVITWLEDHDEVYRGSRRLSFLDPLETMSFVVRINNFEFLVPGAYEIALISDNQTIASKRFEIIHREES